MDSVNTPEPIQLPKEQPEDAPPSDVFVIKQATVYYFLIAILFFVAGFIVAWVTFAVTSQSAVDRARAAAVSAAEELVGTVVAKIPSGGGGGAAVAVAPTDTPIPHQNVDVGDSPSWGPADAKVTVVEFSDFQCPYCEAFYTQTYPLIKSQYADKIHFVYKHFPLTSIHPYAQGAALASECAREQNKFWEYHDTLFSNQQDLTPAALLTYAQKVGMPDVDKFTKCLNSQQYASRVNEQLQAGLGYYVNGTPTFFINGNILVGAQPFNVFKYYIDQALQGAS